MGKIIAWFLLIEIGFFSLPAYTASCSCTWNGPFLAVSRDAPLVIVGKVLRHHPGKSPNMDVLVLETLKGGVLDSGIIVQMGDGMHCRPTLENFPTGSEWVLALNGPGSKPGDGWALSHCGEYWLRLSGGEVIGSIDGTQSLSKRVSWDEFKRKFLYPLFNQRFSGHIVRGKRYCQPFGSRFEFVLEPTHDGWETVVREYGNNENLARLTPPLHSAPNPREIEGWHFLENPSACASRPYLAESGPGNPRKFIFSPEVGKRVDGPNAGRRVTPEEIADIERFGRGILTIEKFGLAPGINGCPEIGWMYFDVQIEGGY